MKRLTLIVLSLSLLASCKKDKTCNKDTAGVSGAYRITAVTYKASAGAVEQDYYPVIFPEVCERDDITTLSSNGTYTFTDAGTKCAPPGDDTGTWSTNGTNITFDSDTQLIESFDCSRMVILQVDAINAGDQLRYVLTRQ